MAGTGGTGPACPRRSESRIGGCWEDGAERFEFGIGGAGPGGLGRGGFGSGGSPSFAASLLLLPTRGLGTEKLGIGGPGWASVAERGGAGAVLLPFREFSVAGSATATSPCSANSSALEGCCVCGFGSGGAVDSWGRLGLPDDDDIALVGTGIRGKGHVDSAGACPLLPGTPRRGGPRGAVAEGKLIATRLSARETGQPVSSAGSRGRTRNVSR